ncbi:hypothetical protein PDIDSM_4458 [Penicillium digitatum]|nr:hypothetical protein PDIDSM_4458 [Penicillium digitatum]
MSQEVFWSQCPLFHNLYSNNYFGNGAFDNVEEDLAAYVRFPHNAEERSTILIEGFVEKISAVLGIATESITLRNSLFAYGLDSIVALEPLANISAFLSKTLELVATEA